MQSPPAPHAGGRLAWPDTMKGISILLIVYFHFFSAYETGRYPWPLSFSNFFGFIAENAPTSTFSTLRYVIEGFCASILQKGPHAVGVFLILSGFGLTYSLTKTGAPKGGWGQWYQKRLLRLFPMYWVAHLVYLVSPLIHHRDAVDYRFVLSLLGDRIYPVDQMFYYINPSWWFFGLLVELYVVFPLLFSLLQKLRPARFLVLCALITFLSRYVLFDVLHANGNYGMGAFFGARLWEFAAGMALGVIYRQRPNAVEEGLFSTPMLFGGMVIYALGLYSYQPGITLLASDALLGTGFFIIAAQVAYWINMIPLLRSLIATAGVYSYGLYLLHHPYVLYFGERLRGLILPEFLLYATLVVSTIALAAIPIEHYVQRLTSRLLDRPKVAPAMSN